MKRELYPELMPVERCWPGPVETEQYPTVPQSVVYELSGEQEDSTTLNNCIKSIRFGLNILSQSAIILRLQSFANSLTSIDAW